MSKTTLLFLIIIGILVGSQFILHKRLKKNPISCGGDWSFNVVCPFASYCKDLEDPLEGGYCSSYLFQYTPVSK